MVHIKKVEIFGFKSFGFRNTTVQFEPGLVSISGPNGSGKSNILDAIIFAMGENKPRIMRVDRLRSLIHDMTATATAPRWQGPASILTISDRKIPVDSDSVEITREMDVNGENTYYLNKRRRTEATYLTCWTWPTRDWGSLTPSSREPSPEYLSSPLTRRERQSRI